MKDWITEAEKAADEMMAEIRGGKPMTDKQDELLLTPKEFAILLYHARKGNWLQSELLKETAKAQLAKAKQHYHPSIEAQKLQVELVKNQERERILGLLPKVTTRFDHNKTCFDCVENIKRQALSQLEEG